jgi:hypothetical protein
LIGFVIRLGFLHLLCYYRAFMIWSFKLHHTIAFLMHSVLLESAMDLSAATIGLFFASKAVYIWVFVRFSRLRFQGAYFLIKVKELTFVGLDLLHIPGFASSFSPSWFSFGSTAFVLNNW